MKFVIDLEEDLQEIEDYIRQFPNMSTSQVYLMPQGSSQEELDRVEAWLKPRCKQLNYQYCPRKQIEWFGAVKGT